MKTLGKHHRRRGLALLAFLLLFLLSGLSAAPRGRAQGETPEPPLLRLRAAEFDPTAQVPAAPAALQRMPSLGGAQLHLVQFPGPIQDEWYQAMLESGLQIVTYLPDYAYLVWGEATALGRLASRAPLRWQGAYLPAYALHPELVAPALNALGRPEESPAEVVTVDVQVVDMPQTQATLAAIQAAARERVRGPYPVLSYQNLTVTLPAERLSWLAALPGVVNVAPRRTFELLDERQAQIIAGNLTPDGVAPSGPGYLAWLQGKGFSSDPNAYPIVDITDDGIDNGTNTPNHPDFYYLGSTSQPDRLSYNLNYTSDGSANGRGGHGNLNAAIVAGYNNRSGNTYRDPAGYSRGLGINPFGRIGGSKVFNNSGNWDYGGSYAALTAAAYSRGARVVSNSWGAATYGDYDVYDQEYDALVRDANPTLSGNQELILIFAAGNSGSGSSTTTSPGNAKNVITVGASENYRPSFEFYTSDACGNEPSGANDAQEIIGFSSRGPTKDGRVKPDLVAPGTMILGAASYIGKYKGTSVCIPYYPYGQSLYAASSGTSHSTPAVAGAASLLYAYYRDRLGGQPPSPAMTKAYLVNSARYLSGSGAGGNLPSNSQGFGLLDLGRAFDGTPRYLVDQSHLFSNSGQTYEVQGIIADPAKPLRVTLAWTDPPGPTTGNAYVNNLNLQVIVNGQTYLGNVFSGATSTTGGTADPRNNVESVFLPAGLSGVVTVRVIAANIAGDGMPGNGDPTDQDFALVVYNVQGGVLGAIHDGASNPLDGAKVQAQPTTGSATKVASQGDGSYRLPIPAGSYTLRAWKAGYALQSISGVELPAFQILTQDFTLSSAATYTLSGCVTDQVTLQGVAATVSVFDPLGDLFTQVTTAEPDYCYSVELSEAEYTLRVEHPFYWPQEVVIDLTENTVQDFALTPKYLRFLPLIRR